MTDAHEPSDSPSPGDLTPTGRQRRSLGRNTAVMASGTAVSRVLGFVRNALLVAALGVNAAGANAFDIANRLPNTMFAVLAAGVINAALVPQIVKAFQRQGGERIVDRILTIGFVITVVLTTLFTLTAQGWVLLYTSDWPPELVALSTAFAFWCIPQLLFYGLYTLLGQVLTAREQFGPFMWAPALNNVVSIAGLLIYLSIFGGFVQGRDEGTEQILAGAWTSGRIALLASSFTVGVMLQALILIVPILRGGYRWRWRWRGPKGELSALRTVIQWALGAVLIEQATVMLVTRIASSANPGDTLPGVAGNFAYTQALSLYLLPHSLVTISLLTALYPTIARHGANNDISALIKEVSRGLRTAGVFTVFATVALIVLAGPAARLIMPTAQPAEIASVGLVLAAMVLGLVALGATVLFKQVYFVLEDARSVFFMHIPMSVAWITVAFTIQRLAEPRWWVVGVALGLAASNVVGVIFRASGLRRRLGSLDGRRVVLTHLKAVVAVIPAAAVGWLLVRWAPDPVDMQGVQAIGTSLWVMALTGTAMAVIYGSMLTLLRVEELNEVIGPLMRKLRRR